MTTTQKIFRWVQFLSAFGIVLALYLLWERFSATPTPLCTVNSVVNCNAIISGAVSTVLGIPTPMYGLTGYIVILLAATFGWKKLVLGMTTGGLAFCLWIAYRELFDLHVICPVCLLCQLDMITVFILGIILQKKVTNTQ